MRRHTREVAAAMIAAGLDPVRNILMVQSHNPDHAELAWIFNCVARVGWLERMTQFKEKAGKNRENASVGLYDYPVLMAADVLVYKATHVPVGEDQKQHLELMRDIAEKFNHDYGQDFPPARAADPRRGDAGDESARRHQEDEQVRSVGLCAHQHDRRCRCHRPEAEEGQDRPASAARQRRRHGGAPEAANLLSIWAALSDSSVDSAVQKFAGATFSISRRSSPISRSRCWGRSPPK